MSRRLPVLPDVPLYPSAWERLRHFFIEIKRQVEQLTPDPIIPGTIQSYSVTSQANVGVVEIVWDPIPNASSYRIYRSTTRDLTTATIICEVYGNGTKRFADSVLESGTYFYWITGVNSLGVEGVPLDLTGVSGVTVTTVSALATDESPNQRVEIDSVNGIRIYDSSNNLTAQFNGTTLSLINGDISGGNITGATFQTAGSGNNRVTIDPTNGFRMYDSSNNLLLQMQASVYAGILLNGLRSIDSNDIFLESNDQSCQLFVSSASNAVSFTAASVARGQIDNNGHQTGAGNLPTSLALRVNNTIKRVNVQQGTGPGFGYLYVG